MTIASNAYAEKVFAEHPIALWPLDEETYYVSLIEETTRTISTTNGWTISGATPEVYGGPGEELPLPVFETSVINKLFSITGEITATSPVVVNNYSELNETISNISLGTFVYPFSETFSIQVGIKYTVDSEEYTDSQGYEIDVTGASKWAFVSGVFELPANFEDLRIVLTISVDNPELSSEILIHGITLGQWSENFQVESLGVTPQNIPDTVAVDGIGSLISTYGLQTASGYYMVNHNTLRANNSGLPMVYGADNSTVVTPNFDVVEDVLITKPSMILPGYGFLNKDGQYSDLTFEAWLKIQSSATIPKKIWGPVASEDGLYVNDAFLVLKIGEYNSSYYVGEWDRPMLVQIRLSATQADLLINGEEVSSTTIDPNQVSFPDKFDLDGKDQDWVAFYAYDDVKRIEVDSVAIYPYKVPAIVAKRRWVYGQGVEAAETISGSNLGTTVSFDYTFANYAKNYFYPDMGRWNQGIQENIVVDNTSLSLPQYPLPILNFNNKTTDQWYGDNSGLSALFGTYVSLRPTSEWDNTEGYILFPNFNLLQQDLKGFYGLFETDASNSSKQTLFLLQNETTGESLEIAVEGATTTYIYTYLDNVDGVLQSVSLPPLSTDNFHIPGEFLFAGLDIDKFSKYAGGQVAQFLGSKQNLKLYVGGRPDLTQTLSGNIYRIGFCTARNLEKIANVFASTGLPVGFNAIDASNVIDAGGTIFTNDNPPAGIFNWDQYFDGGDQYFGNSSNIYEEEIDGGGVYSLLVSYILDHVASYTLIPKDFLDKFMLDVAVNSYWQDYLPLSYFAKFVTDGTVKVVDQVDRANKYLDVDFIQLNIDYPVINKFLANSYDTRNAIVRTYVSFQELSQEPSILASRFSNTVLAPKNGVVSPGVNLQVESNTFSIVEKWLSNNVITLRTSGSHNFNVGDVVEISGVDDVSDNIFDGEYKILYVTKDTFSYSKLETYVAPTPVSNGNASVITRTIIPAWKTIAEDGTTTYTKYEVVNDTLIYPPRDMPFDQLAIVFHIEIISSGIQENPVIIKSLQLASQALNGFVPNAIGTKFGTEVFPYKKSVERYDYKGVNPFSIYKKNTPYFYLTSNSGMRLRGFYDGDIERGIEIPINKNAAQFYKVTAWQMALRYDDETFPEGVRPLFEIYAKSLEKENKGEDYIRHLKFYMTPDDSTLRRGRIYAIDAETGLEDTTITYYINGRKVHNPVLEANNWSVLGLTFTEPFDFSGYPGYMSITGPILFNNVSHYQISAADEAARSVYRKWFSVKTLEGEDEDWEYWKTLDADPELGGIQTYTWQNVLFISSNELVGVNGKTIYRKYTGTDRIVVDSQNEFRITGYQYQIYKNLSWQTAVITPV